MNIEQPTPCDRLRDLLRETFGFEDFRPRQEAVCRAVTEGSDVLLVMPTGAGKSLCYQLPGIARGGTTLVVSPLISLMEDQVAKLRAHGLRAERIHSGRPRPAARQACRDYLEGCIDFLLIAPERLGVPGFPELLARRRLALVAVDEAHCISHWGHDFRPDYRMLGARLPLLRPAPVIAVTATATPLVQRDICEQLAIPRARRFIHGFRRENIAIELAEMKPTARIEVAERLLADPSNRPAIVYAPTRRQAEELASRFSSLCAVAGYHAGMTAGERDGVQAAFREGRLEAIVATIAFGMGIDKPDIRTVIHMAMPASVEGYYQEIGRAGRDGALSRAVLLHGWSDRRNHEFFMDRDYPEASVLREVWSVLPVEPRPRDEVASPAGLEADRLDNALEKLRIHGGARIDAAGNVARGPSEWEGAYLAQRRHRLEQLALVTRFAGSRGCRMVHMVAHFGDQEDDGRPCGRCDMCAPRDCVALRFRAPFAGEQEALGRIVEALLRASGQPAGRLHRDLFGDALDRDRFERLIAALVRAGFLFERVASFEKDGRAIEFRKLFLSVAGRRATELGSVPVAIEAPSPGRDRSRRSDRPTKSASRARAEPGDGGEANPDPALIEALRAWRLAEARRRRVPAYCVMPNRTLEAIAVARPRDEEALLDVRGVGHLVVERFGAAILDLLRRSRAEGAEP